MLKIVESKEGFLYLIITSDKGSAVSILDLKDCVKEYIDPNDKTKIPGI